MARQLEAWAGQDEPAGAEVTAADLLVAAGEQLLRVGDTAEAVRLFRLAVATGKPTTPDARCFLHNALLKAEDVEAARAEDERGETTSGAELRVEFGLDE